MMKTNKGDDQFANTPASGEEVAGDWKPPSGSRRLKVATEKWFTSEFFWAGEIKGPLSKTIIKTSKDRSKRLIRT